MIHEVVSVVSMKRITARGSTSTSVPKEKVVIPISSDSELEPKLEDTIHEVVKMDEDYEEDPEKDPEEAPQDAEVEEYPEEDPKEEEDEVEEHFRGEEHAPQDSALREL
ncbi:hypothetical protein PIB30_078735 [Stylosanthes scabra]|uniref:Uncharacterized protein n=1 Tax=Stylosanthes scabra TaxID=79078 RepID=A0ABU6QQI5_9FABA|nr:hypothetical protein [Stylosanthes scabra]